MTKIVLIFPNLHCAQIDELFETYHETCQYIESQLEDAEIESDDSEGPDNEPNKTDTSLQAHKCGSHFQQEFEQHLAGSGINPNQRIVNDIPDDNGSMDLNSQTDAENCLDVFVSMSSGGNNDRPNKLLPKNVFNTKGFVRTTKVPSSNINSKGKVAASKKWQHLNTGPLPLLIRDILRIPIESASKLYSEREMYGRRFRKVIFYGRCEPVTTRSSKYDGRSEQIDTNKRIYRIDDGSGNITVHFMHASKKYQSEYYSIYQSKSRTLHKFSHRIDESHSRLPYHFNIDLQRGINQLSNEYDDACRCGIPYLGGDYPPTTARCQQMLGHLKTIIAVIKRNAYMRQDYFTNGSKICVVGTPFLNTSNNTVQIIGFDMFEDHQANRQMEINFKHTLYEFYDKKYLRQEMIK